MRSKWILAAAALWLASCSKPQPGETIAGGDAVRGAAAIAKYGCGSCHTIGGISGATGMVGPPLIGLRNRMYVAGMLPNNSTNLARWISNPKLVNPGTVMPVLGVGPSEATDIAAYIYSMK
jgi:cytochrome c